MHQVRYDVSSAFTCSASSGGVSADAGRIRTSTLCSSSSNLTSISGPAFVSLVDADTTTFLLLLLLAAPLIALRALGHNPSLNSHCSHFGPTGAHMVCSGDHRTGQHAPWDATTPRKSQRQARRGTHLTEPHEQVVDLWMQLLRQPRLQVQPAGHMIKLQGSARAAPYEVARE